MIGKRFMGKIKLGGHFAVDFAGAKEAQKVNIDDIEEDTEASSYKPQTVEMEEGTKSHAGTPKNRSSKSFDSKKKRKVDNNDDALVEAITSFCTNASSSIEKVASRIGAKIDASRRRAELFDAISLLPIDINEDEQMLVAYKITKDKKAMDMFFGMSMGSQMNMVNMVLKGKLK